MSGSVGILGLTAACAFVATAVIAAPGVAIAWWLARTRSRARVVVETILSIPLVLPPTAIGFLLFFALRPSGAIGRALAGIGVEVLYTFRAVVVAAAIMSFPLLVRGCRTAFEEIDPRLLDVARTLGATPVRAFLRVGVPLAWRGIVAGLLLSFTRALGEFGATILVAGNIAGETQTLSLAIFQRWQRGDDPGAMRLVAITVALAFAAVLASELLVRRRDRRVA